MESRTLKFENFWPSFDPEHNKFTDALRTRFDICVIPDGSSDNPDILIYSQIGTPKHYHYDSLKIYYTGENDFPDFNECDYAISFHDCDCGGRNLRYPLWMLYGLTDAAMSCDGPDNDTLLRRPFASVVMSNTSGCDPRRLAIIDGVEKYKPLAYGGSYRNNVGGRVPDKLEFIARYKFNLALENSVAPGYVTEKILESMASRTIPIYFGDSRVLRDFNPDSFINAGDYSSIDNLVAGIAGIDADPEAYLRMLNAPKFAGPGVLQPADHDLQLTEYLCGIAAGMQRHTTSYGMAGTLQRIKSASLPLFYSRTGRKLLHWLAK